MKCEHGTPHHQTCNACELRISRTEVARLRRELSDAEVRLALLVIDQGNGPRRVVA